jgi:hypothetical protein
MNGLLYASDYDHPLEYYCATSQKWKMSKMKDVEGMIALVVKKLFVGIKA